MRWSKSTHKLLLFPVPQCLFSYDHGNPSPLVTIPEKPQLTCMSVFSYPFSVATGVSFSLLSTAIIFLFFGSTRVWTQGLSSRQVLCHLNRAPSPFIFSYFGARVSCLCLVSLNCCPSIYASCTARMTSAYHHTQHCFSFWWHWGLNSALGVFQADTFTACTTLPAMPSFYWSRWGSCELFSQLDLETQSSQSLPPK
jgi:hypothetical protein